MAPRRFRTSVSPWTILAWLVLAAAVVIPAIAAGFLTNIWAWAGGVALLGALLLASRAHPTPEGGGKIIAWASLIFPSVERYKKTLENRQQILSANEAISANMRRIINDYDLALGDDTALTLFDQAMDLLSGWGIEPNRLTVKECADQAAAILSPTLSFTEDAADKEERNAVLSDALQVLFCTDRQAVERQLEIWQKANAHRMNALKTALTAIVQRHDRMRWPDGTPRFADGKVSAAILALQPRFSFEGLVAHLNDTPFGVFNNMSTAMKLYGLPTPGDTDRNRIVANLKGVVGINVPRRCAEEVSGLGHVSQSPELLELLYREHVGRTTGGIWQSNTVDLIDELAPILADSPLLEPTMKGADRDDVEMVARHVLPDFEQFDHRAVNVIVTRFWAIWTDLARYAELLEAGGIAAEPSLAAMLDRLPDAAASPAIHWSDLLGPDTVADVILQIGTEWFEDQADEPLSLAVLTLGLYTAIEAEATPGLEAAIARRTARGAHTEKALPMLLGSLWHAAETRTLLASLPLTVLATEWPQWESQARHQYGDKVIDSLYEALGSQLRKGTWPMRLPVELTLAVIAERVRHLLQAMESTEPGAGDLQAVQSLTAIAGAAEQWLAEAPAAGSGDGGVYMITFDGRTGPVADLIDCLSPKSNPDRQPAACEELLEAHNVVRDIYDFVPYTRYARIGHLPTDLTFAEFHEQFHHDLTVVLDKRKQLIRKNPAWWVKHELEDVEVTLQQIIHATRHNFDTTLFDDAVRPTGRKDEDWLREWSVITQGFERPANKVEQ